MQTNRALVADIRRVHAEHRGRYASPRIHATLCAEEQSVSRGRIERLMRQHGIRGLAGRKFRPCTTDSRHSRPIAPNLLQQDFHATVPNRVWLADITDIPTGEGWSYLAAVTDLATRKIVGWAMSHHVRAELPIAAPMQDSFSARIYPPPGTGRDLARLSHPSAKTRVHQNAIFTPPFTPLAVNRLPYWPI